MAFADNKQLDVTDTAAQASTSGDRPGTEGQTFAFYNAGSSTVYMGFGSDVTAANGIPVAAGGWSPSVDFAPRDATEHVWLVCDTGESSDARIIETGLN